MRPRLYYCNGGFDLELAVTLPPRFKPQVEEMTLWFLPLTMPGDKIILDTAVPDDYAEYLCSVGLTPARPLAPAEKLDECEPVVWGWNKESVSRMLNHGITPHCPDLDVIRRVNARPFAFELAQKMGTALPGACLCGSGEEIARVLFHWCAWPAVIKPPHGNSGLGFIIVRGPQELRRALSRAQQVLFDQKDFLTIEPWVERRMDLSIRLELAPDGSLEDVSWARTMVTLRGASYGVVRVPNDPLIAPYIPTLQATAVSVGKALSTAGYWGPVNVDAMIAVVDGRECLVPLVEINARQSLSYIAAELQRRLAPECPCMLRTLGRSRHTLPSTYDQLRNWLGENMFDIRTHRGIALLTPLRLEHHHRRQQPERSIFFLVGRTVEELDQLHRSLTALRSRPL